MGCPFSVRRFFSLCPASPVRRTPLFVLIVVSGFLAGSLAAQTPQEVQRTAEQAIHRLDLQTELPREQETLLFSIKLPAETLWLVIAVALGVLIYSFRDMIPVLRRTRGGAW